MEKINKTLVCIYDTHIYTRDDNPEKEKDPKEIIIGSFDFLSDAYDFILEIYEDLKSCY